MALYRRARGTRLLVVTLVMLSLLTITVDYRGGRSGPFAVAGRATQTVVGVLQSGASKILHPIGAFFGGLGRVATLQSQNRSLTEEVRALRVKLARNSNIQLQLEKLQKLYDLQQNLQLRGVAALVIAYSPGNFQWTITVNRGSRDAVQLDQPVVSGDGLVGHVIAVTPTTAIVQLILDRDSFVTGRLTSTGDTGGVRGNGNQDLQMDLVDPSVKVTPGEQVITAGLQRLLYPPGIPIGAVSHVYAPAGALTKTISIRPAVDFSALETVLIVTGQSSKLGR